MKATKKAEATRPVPSPAAVAKKIAEDFGRQFTDYHSDLVSLLDDAKDGAITDAVRAHRLAMESSGKWRKVSEKEGAEHDERVAMFQLGYALGARFGGVR